MFDLDWTLIVTVPAVLLAIILHEIAHGLVAYWLGDRTAKEQGRLTLNPLPHIDLVGLLLMIFVKFGWARPVPVDIRNFKNPRRGFALTALAGPVMNFLLAFVSIFLLNLLFFLFPTFFFVDPYTFASVFAEGVYLFFYLLGVVSIGLGLFNLIPIPPLDGSKIVGLLLPDRVYYRVLRYERYGMFLLIVLIYAGNLIPALDLFTPLHSVRMAIYEAFDWVAAQPFLMLSGFVA